MSRKQVKHLSLCCLFALEAFGASSIRAQAAEAPIALQLRLDGGGGSHQSSLPSAEGTRRVAAAWFPAVGLRLAVFERAGSRVRFGGELAYTSSIGYELERSITSDTSEGSTGRAQEFGVFGSMSIALQSGAHPISLPIAVGYAGSAFTTDTPLAAAQAYLISGPRAAVGIDAPLFAARLRLLARGEIGANLTATDGLKNAGVGAVGITYAFSAGADMRLAKVLSLGLHYRETHAELPVSGRNGFHEIHRFVLASLTLSNAR